MTIGPLLPLGQDPDGKNIGQTGIGQAFPDGATFASAEGASLRLGLSRTSFSVTATGTLVTSGSAAIADREAATATGTFVTSGSAAASIIPGTTTQPTAGGEVWRHGVAYYCPVCQPLRRFANATERDLHVRKLHPLPKPVHTNPEPVPIITAEPVWLIVDDFEELLLLDLI